MGGGGQLASEEVLSGEIKEFELEHGMDDL